MQVDDDADSGVLICWFGFTGPLRPYFSLYIIITGKRDFNVSSLFPVISLSFCYIKLTGNRCCLSFILDIDLLWTSLGVFLGGKLVMSLLKFRVLTSYSTSSVSCLITWRHVILFGNPDLTTHSNTQIFNAVQSFILKTKRFLVNQ